RIARQYIAGGQIVWGSGDDLVDRPQEAVHQRAVESQEGLLTHDVRMVAEHAWFAMPGVEVHQVHQWPWEVVVDDIHVSSQFTEAPENFPGQEIGRATGRERAER